MTVPNWIPLSGIWEFGPRRAEYLGQGSPDALHPLGIALSSGALSNGAVEVDVALDAIDKDAAARVLVNYDPKSGEYLSVGLGGYGRAYVISQFVANQGWRALEVAGDWQNLKEGQNYHLHVSVKGQVIGLRVDGIPVFDLQLAEPMRGTQVGLKVWGNHRIAFKNFRLTADEPLGFVVMDFSGQYDALYRDVLHPVAQHANATLRRADDIKGPGIILQDIVKDIAESSFVVAEVSPANPNVFYELGYAHALKKPTVLLVKRGEKLPFDIAGYRVIFYEDSIAGKAEVEKEFRKHLESILGTN